MLNNRNFVKLGPPCLWPARVGMATLSTKGSGHVPAQCLPVWEMACKTGRRMGLRSCSVLKRSTVICTVLTAVRSPVTRLDQGRAERRPGREKPEDECFSFPFSSTYLIVFQHETADEKQRGRHFPSFIIWPSFVSSLFPVQLSPSLGTGVSSFGTTHQSLSFPPFTPVIRARPSFRDSTCAFCPRSIVPEGSSAGNPAVILRNTRCLFSAVRTICLPETHLSVVRCPSKQATEPSQPFLHIHPHRLSVLSGFENPLPRALAPLSVIS